MALKNISKSRFIAGLQCEKRLWLELHKRDLMNETTESKQFIFDQGHEIGELAQKLFPGGVLIDEEYFKTAEAVKSTEKAIQSGASCIYEATAQFGRYLARADILKRVHDGKNEWDILEVKSGSHEDKQVYLDDLAIQKMIFEGAGFVIRNTHLITIDTDYVRQGDIEINKLFLITDQTKAVSDICKNLPAKMKRFLEVADTFKEPRISISNLRCYSPYDCPFIDYCWKGMPVDSIFTLANDRKKIADNLFPKGIVKIADIPDDAPLSIKQRRQVEVARTGKPFWDTGEIEEFLKDLEYPLCFLDFETYCPAIPPYDGLRPYRQIPFQYSLHILTKPNGELNHHEFLADGQCDPREFFMDELLKVIGEKGSVVVHSSFEQSRLNDLAEWYSRYASDVRAINKRISDLTVPFRNQDVLYPEFLGSYSIKAVLPVLVPDMSYDNLEIGEGGAASMAYVKLMKPDVSDADKKKIRKDLLDYCGQDTLAMVKLVEILKSKVKK